jgi:hypothetical protein
MMKDYAVPYGIMGNCGANAHRLDRATTQDGSGEMLSPGEYADIAV